MAKTTFLMLLLVVLPIVGCKSGGGQDSGSSQTLDAASPETLMGKFLVGRPGQSSTLSYSLVMQAGANNTTEPVLTTAVVDRGNLGVDVVAVNGITMDFRPKGGAGNFEVESNTIYLKFLGGKISTGDYYGIDVFPAQE